MQLLLEIPSATLPIIGFHGTLDTNVPSTVWASLLPGKVSQARWRGGLGGTQVAFAAIIGGTHTFLPPTVQTGFDFTYGIF